MTDTFEADEREPVDAELRQADEAHPERQQLEERAARADELEMRLALEHAGIPDTEPVRPWLAHVYDGP